MIGIKNEKFMKYSLKKLLNIKQVISEDEVTMIQTELDQLDIKDKDLIINRIRNEAGTSYE